MRRMTTIVLGALIGLGLSVAAPAVVGTQSIAGAQTGYPPPPPSTGTITLSIGQTGSFTACGFLPGSTVTITYGSFSTTTTADASGCVTVTIAVSDPHISINGGPLLLANCGPNTITLSGVTSTGSPPTTVGLTAAAVVTTTTPRTFQEVLNIVGGSCVAPAVVVTPARPVPPPVPSLAFTGADIAYTTIGGLLLIGLGTALLVIVSRRRRRAT